MSGRLRTVPDGSGRLLVGPINTKLASISHGFRDIAFDRSKLALFGYPLCLTPPTEGFPWKISVKLYLDVNGWPSYQMA